MGTLALQQRISSSIEQHREEYIAISQDIHAHPETGNNEYYASGLLTELLKKHHFTVTLNVAGHETAFYAEKDSGKPGPTIAYLAEYDALIDIGHACGHNIIGVTSLAAAIALAEVIDQTGGKVVVLGTPAEEGGLRGKGGINGNVKARFVEHGFLDRVDVALMVHPSGKTRLTGPSLANNHLYFHFYGKPSHAGSSPHKGVNALDALVLLYNGISVLRQQLPDGVRVHGIITNGGQAPNVIPEYASAHYYIRAKTREEVVALEPRIRAIADGVALATGTTVKIEHQVGPRDFLINHSLNAILLEEFTAAGEVVDQKAKEGIGSTDAGDISHAVPTAHPTIKIGPDDLIGHTVPFREAANSPLGYAALLTGAQVLARTGLRLLTDPRALQGAKDEFAGRRSVTDAA
ncbi:M20 family metallopeptidase [Pectobacterium carotovorum]|uniref:M20 family metallopeptidase n=1 Tax=Pectobacterium carotovorum TaxID=554 RepID=UPI00057CB3BB|nr:M20 family metallopeptidase [Pectobacterium carotovorum]KHT34519.1 amidohydrolase [Pectobacterium carotovorum subsp. carotovorum]MBL0865081.1 M20 family metallopeptidase [Pectobacterium carotovorum]MDY4373123.1 M20 family metallopeptidase [Pectobacterium carotovorum subsp. carotovorum]GKW37562.1 amidohydrolase [Pectobacterium carotovorum subsp. carotovorum]